MTLDKTSLPAINTKDTRTMTLNILIVAHFLGDCRMTALPGLHINKKVLAVLIFTVKVAIFYMLQRALINVWSPKEKPQKKFQVSMSLILGAKSPKS